MKTDSYSRFMPFSIIMPFLGLALSLSLLFPYRQLLVAEIRFAFSPRSQVQYSLPPNLDMDEVLQVASKFNFDPDGHEKRYTQVTILNLPALVADLPMAIFSKDHTSWCPAGMDFKTWSAISYPIIGILFWWLVGRGLDALLRSSARLNWVELGVSLLIFIGAGVLCVGWIVTATPDDRADPTFRWLVVGALLWFFLEAIIIAGWIKQTTTRRRLTRLQNV